MAAGSPGTFSSTGFDKFFLEYVKPGLEKGFYTNSKLYDRFKTATETCLGKYGVAKVETVNATSFRGANSTAYPTSADPQYGEFTFYMKRLYGKLDFDGLLVACSQGAGAVKELVKQNTASLMGYIPRKLNKYYWGDGSGRLAIVSNAATGTAPTVDGDTTNWGLFGIDSSGYTNPSQYLFQNMEIDAYRSGPTQGGDSITITAISQGGAGTDTLTTDSWTYASNDFILDEDIYAATEAAGTGAPMGLAGIVTTANPYIGITASSAFQGVNRSTAGNEWASGQVFNMGSAITSPAVITESKILQTIMALEKWGTVKVMITNEFIWRALFEILKADKTMPNDPGYWGGLTGIKFYGGKTNSIPIVWDEDCPDGRVYFLDDSSIKISAPVKNGLTFEPGSSGHILTKREDYDCYTANLKMYYNMTCTRPRANGLLRYVKHASA
ncbi:MAG: phage major capsid protein [Dehalococcoidia bacterium]|jgi:hypothetical protein